MKTQKIKHAIEHGNHQTIRQVLKDSGYNINKPFIQGNKELYAPYIIMNLDRLTQKEKIECLQMLHKFGLSYKLLLDNCLTSSCQNVSISEIDMNTDISNIPFGNIINVINKKQFLLLQYILKRNKFLFKNDDYHVGNIVIKDPIINILRLLRDIYPSSELDQWINVVAMILKNVNELPIHFVKSIFNKFIRYNVPFSMYSNILKFIPIGERIEFLREELYFLRNEELHQYFTDIINSLQNIKTIENLRNKHDTKGHKIMLKLQKQVQKQATYQFLKGFASMSEDLFTDFKKQYVFI